LLKDWDMKIPTGNLPGSLKKADHALDCMFLPASSAVFLFPVNELAKTYG
jgi:hypothetical protein